MDPLQEVAQLRKENHELRKALEQAQAKGRSNKKLTCLILTPILLVGSIVMISILAAVALPMYSTFKQKSKVAGALKSLHEAQPALEAYFDEKGNFNGLEVQAGGGPLHVGDIRVGAELVNMPAMTWDIYQEGSLLQLQFNWDPISACPAEFCDGIWQLDCTEGTPCKVNAKVGTENQLGLGY